MGTGRVCVWCTISLTISEVKLKSLCGLVLRLNGAFLFFFYFPFAEIKSSNHNFPMRFYCIPFWHWLHYTAVCGTLCAVANRLECGAALISIQTHETNNKQIIKKQSVCNIKKIGVVAAVRWPRNRFCKTISLEKSFNEIATQFNYDNNKRRWLLSHFRPFHHFPNWNGLWVPECRSRRKKKVWTLNKYVQNNENADAAVLFKLYALRYAPFDSILWETI